MNNLPSDFKRTLPPLTSKECRDLFTNVRDQIIKAAQANRLLDLEVAIKQMNDMRLEQWTINVSNGMSGKPFVADTIESVMANLKSKGLV